MKLLPRTASIVTLAVLSALAQAAEPAQPVVKLDIEAQPISEALNEFARQTGLQVVIDWNDGEGIASRPLKGTFTSQAALEKLLAGTDLTYQYLNDRIVAVSRKGKANDNAARPRTINASSQSSAAAGYQGTSWTKVASAEGETREFPRDEANEAQRGPTLEEVIITGTHIRGADVAAPMMIITREEIDRSGYTTAEELFESIPQNFSGLSADGHFADGGSRIAQGNSLSRTTAIDLRGLGPESTLTLLNGQRRAGGNSGRVVDIGAIPLSMIERVDVLTGGRSAIYGADAVAGVANIVLRRTFDGAQTSVTFGAPSNDAGGERVQVSQIAGIERSKGGFVAAYDYLQESAFDLVKAGLTTTTESGIVTRKMETLPEAWRHSFMAAGNYSLTDDIELYADGFFTSRKTSGVYVQWMPDTVNDGYSGTSNRSESYSVAGGLRSQLKADWSVDVSVTATTSNEQLAYDSYTEYYFPGYGVFGSSTSDSIDERNTIKAGTIVADGSLRTFGNVTPHLALGASVRSEAFQSITGAAPYRMDRTVRSAFGEILLPLSTTHSGLRRFELSLAGRYDDYSDFGSVFNPQAGVIWEPIIGLNFRATYAEAYRPPALMERNALSTVVLSQQDDPLASSGRTPVLMVSGVDPHLGAEKADSWTMALDWIPAFAPDLKFSISYFDIDYVDRIDVPAGSGDIYRALVLEDQFVSLINRAPASQDVSAAIAAASRFFSEMPFDPATQDALAVFPGLVMFDNRTTNIAIQKVRGVDFGVDGRMRSAVGEISFGLNATFNQQLEKWMTPTSPAILMQNEVGKPVDLRLRANVGWTHSAWGAYLHLNYVDNYKNPVRSPATKISSWTTADLTVRFQGDGSGVEWLSGVDVSLSARNIFDRDPPRFGDNTRGLLYDPANANALGRYVTLG